MDLLQSMPSLNMLSLASINTTTEDPISESCDPRNILQLVAKVLSSQGFLPNLEYTGELYHCAISCHPSITLYMY